MNRLNVIRDFCQRAGLMLLPVVLLLSSSCWAVELKSGTVIGRHIFGLAQDIDGDPLQQAGRSLIYPESDESVLMDYEDTHFQITAFNHLIGNIYLTQLTGEPLQALDTRALDLSSAGGLTHPSGFVKTDWNSVILMEQIALNSRDSDSFINDFKAYYKGNAELINVYNYGWVSEIIMLDNRGESKLIKNYALGRVFASELLIMPDNQTLYLLDKNGSGNIYMFVAEKAQSFASGELFVLDFSSKKPRYVSLGNGNALKMKFKLKKLRFADLFDYAEAKNKSCAPGLSYINTVFGEECLKLKTKNRKYAGLFEPARYAALQAVASPTSKISSIHYDPANNSMMFKSGQQQELKFNLIPNEKLKTQFAIR